MNCQICNKEFSTVYNRNKHQRVSKCSNALKCENCNMHYVNLSKHLPDCVVNLKNRNVELEKKIVDLESKMYNMTHERLDELHQQMKELAKKVDEKSQVQVNNHINIKIQNLQVLNRSDFETFSENLTIDHIKKGATGYAEYAITYPLNNKIVCTDFSRRKVKYKTDEGEVKSDINMISLSKDLFDSINVRNKELIFQYAREYIEPIDDPEKKMNAYVKFMNYISLIKEGDQHELYPDFVKQICSLSN